MASQYVSLLGDAYSLPNYLASNQRRYNLIGEPVPQKGEEPIRYYQKSRPGLTLLSTAPEQPIRGLYTASTEDLWACAGQGIYLVDRDWHWHIKQVISPTEPANVVPLRTPVSFADNGTQMIVADGSTRGWTFDLQAQTSNGLITDPNWQGATWVDFMDTFGLANQPNSPIFRVSVAEDLTNWNNGFASMTGIATNCIAALNVHRVLWTIGQLSVEVWQDTGGAGTISDQFPFQTIQAAFENVGCVAPYSIARTENEVFWLSQDRSGHGIVLLGTGAATIKRISTFAIESEIGTYPDISDAISYTYQQDGHTFLCMTFPSANQPYGKTWVYDTRTEQWAERGWIDDNGVEWRERPSFATNAYGINVAGDWQTGQIYEFDVKNFTDDGKTIKWVVRSPHIMDVNTLNRVRHTSVRVNMEVGSANMLIPQTVVNCSFHAADGTLMQNYTNIDDVGSIFTKITSVNAQIDSNAMIAIVSGTPEYELSGVPTVADYVTTFTIKPQLYSTMPPPGSFLYAVTRTDASFNGIISGIYSDGTNFLILLGLLPSPSYIEATLGVPAEGGTYTVKLSNIGTGITVAVQRSQDSYWLDPSSNWVPSPTTCLALSNSTYNDPGNILVGGTWIE